MLLALLVSAEICCSVEYVVTFALRLPVARFGVSIAVRLRRTLFDGCSLIWIVVVLFARLVGEGSATLDLVELLFGGILGPLSFSKYL